MVPAPALVPVAFSLALAWWPLRRLPYRARWSSTAALCAVLVALPCLADRSSLAALAGLTLLSAAALPAKTIDAAVAPSPWADRPFREWVVFLALPFVVCFRGHLRDPVRPRGESARLALRGAVESLAGAALLAWALRADWSGVPRPVEHLTKLVGLYLLVLDGAFVVATGLLRLAGFPIHDLSRHPVLATTPADFWRRYNRDAGRFFFENLYRRLPLRSSAARVMVVFAANGLAHELLAWILAGRPLGLPLAFFLLQGGAVAVTGRWRPTGVRVHAARAATFAFMVASSWLVLASVDAIVPWFSRR